MSGAKKSGTGLKTAGLLLSIIGVIGYAGASSVSPYFLLAILVGFGVFVAGRLRD